MRFPDPAAIFGAMRKTAYFVVVLANIFACGSNPPEQNTQAAATEAPSPPARDLPLPTADAPPAPSPILETADQGLAAFVENVAAGEPGAQPSAVTISAESGLNRISVHVTNYIHYCAPAPSFAPFVTGETLELRQIQPQNVSRCFSPQSFDVNVRIPGRNNVRRVALLRDGTEIASGPVH